MPQLANIIDIVFSPSVGWLRPVLDEAGPFGFGDYTLTQFTSTAGVLLGDPTHNVTGTFGVIVLFAGAFPSTWSIEFGYDSGGALGHEGDRYTPRLAQVVPQHELIGGFFAPLDYVDIVHIPQVVSWPFRPVGGDRVGLHVTPDCSVDLYYLCLP
jgi:hypothetical protein